MIHAMTIFYDMIHVCMYPQKLMRARGLKEQQIAIIHILTDTKLFKNNSADIQDCYLAKRLI